MAERKQRAFWLAGVLILVCFGLTVGKHFMRPLFSNWMDWEQKGIPVWARGHGFYEDNGRVLLCDQRLNIVVVGIPEDDERLSNIVRDSSPFCARLFSGSKHEIIVRRCSNVLILANQGADTKIPLPADAATRIEQELWRKRGEDVEYSIRDEILAWINDEAREAVRNAIPKQREIKP